MKNKIVLLILSVLFFLVCCLPAIWGELTDRPQRIRKQEIIADINANIYPGLRQEEVEEFLIERNIEYSWLEKENKFLAIVRDVRKAPFIIESLQMSVYLDSDQEVISMTIEPVYTTP